MNEVQLIDKFLKRLTQKKSSSQGLNDDIFFDKSNKLAVSVDTYVEKVHFPNFKAPDLVIKKILRSSLSDLICKGVKPKYYFISASGNSKSFSNKNLRKISNSLSLEQKKFDIELSGGDTVFSNTNSFTCCVIGFSNKIVKRHNSMIGDDVYITGHLGDSFIGLQILKKKISIPKLLKNYFISKFYMPSINLKMVNFLQKFANTSIDISDGLLIDLKKMIRQLIECVPNISEGRDTKKIQEIANAVETIEGVKLLNIDPGKATNRTVITFVGEPQQVIDAAFLLIQKAQNLIDMSKHSGEHPRMGATDVCYRY